MKLTKCEQGHYFDADKYPACPYCNTELQTESVIVRTSEPAPAETGVPGVPGGPVAGWLVVMDGPAKGRDLRLGVGRSFLGVDAAGMPVTLDPDSPLGVRQAAVAYDASAGVFTLLPGSSQELCYLAGQALLEPQPLVGGEELKLGDATLRFVPFCDGTFHW